MNPSRGLSSAPATPLLLGDTRAMLVYPCSGTKAHQPPTASAAATAPWEGGFLRGSDTCRGPTSPLTSSPWVERGLGANSPCFGLCSDLVCF